MMLQLTLGAPPQPTNTAWDHASATFSNEKDQNKPSEDQRVSFRSKINLTIPGTLHIVTSFILKLELWVNFDHKDCFWANYFGSYHDLVYIFSPISVCLLLNTSNGQTDGNWTNITK